MDRNRYTLTYRVAETSKVMGWIGASASGSVIGLRGAGKSNFLRFLLRQDVQQHYLGKKNFNYVFILINLLPLDRFTEWAVYELILNDILRHLDALGIQDDMIERIASLHQQVVRDRDALLARRAFERCIDMLCQQERQYLVLLFDEFDKVYQKIGLSLFNCLRAIRDAHKGQVSYIVVVTDKLSQLQPDWEPVSHFAAMLRHNVCGLGPYSEDDARQMICYLTSQRSIALSEQETAHLIELSGGHARLLKAIVSQLWDAPSKDDFVEKLASLLETQTVQVECQKIWQSLPVEQQAASQALVSGLKVNVDMLHYLNLKGLIRDNGTELFFFSPVFADFVRSQVCSKSIIISRSPRQVRLDGREIKTLSALEFELLYYLYEHRGCVCTKDELAQNVYRNRYEATTGEISDQMLYTLISRLRAKINPKDTQHQYVIAVRGEGYKFVEPGDE